MVKPSFMKQTDSRWATKRYRTKDGGKPSVGGAGCGPTCIANIVDALIRPITPLEIFKYACKHGYMTGNSGTYWTGITAMLKHYGITKFKVTQSSSDAKASLKAGHWLIGVVGPSIWTRGGHYILLYHITKSDRLWISDPASYSDARQKTGTWKQFHNAVNCMWIDIDPKDYKKAVKPSPAKSVSSTYTYYIQSPKGASVMAERSSKSAKVGTLKYKSKIKVKKYKNKWWMIASGKFKGKFINQTHLSKYKPYKATFQVIPSEGLRVRKGYTTKSEVIKVIAKGKKVTCSKIKGNWAYIPKYKGWMKIKDDKTIYLKKVK